MSILSHAMSPAASVSFTRKAGLIGFALSVLAATAQPLSAHDFKAGDIAVGHPWSRATPEGAKVAAGYFVLKNGGAEADRLVSVSSEIAGRTEIHEMAVNAQGVMTMRPLADGVEVPAGGEVALKPGSYHVMFMDLKTAPVEGKPFSGTLTFEKSGTVEVEFAVEAIGGSGGHGDNGHGSTGHGGHGG